MSADPAPGRWRREVLLTLGARRLPAAETALLSLTETVLGPIWVWLAIDETPSLLTLAGGLIVMIAVVGHALLGLRERGTPPAATLGE